MTNWIFRQQKSISKLIFAGYTGCKNQVWNRLKIQFVELDFSEIKYRSTGGWAFLGLDFWGCHSIIVYNLNLLVKCTYLTTSIEHPWKVFAKGESCSLDPITNFESCLYKVFKIFQTSRQKIDLRKTRQTKISATEHTPENTWTLLLLILNFFPGPTALLKGPKFIKFSMKNRKYHFLRFFHNKQSQNFAKFSMPYVYSLSYVYSGV